MSLSDELGRLGELHQRGVLSDDEFSRAKARVLNGTEPSRAGPAMSMINGLRRSRNDRWLGGVCGGLAEASSIAPWGWRMIFTLLVLWAGTGGALYVLLWIFMPDTPAPIGDRLA